MLASLPPPGFGAVCCEKRPASERSVKTPPASVPTAMHDPGAAHDTALRLLEGSATASDGVAAGVHPLPLSVRTSGTLTPAASVSEPTAVQLIAAAQEMPVS